ncbi:Hypothetical predicted protein [Pelobates cultripes]|uniref:Uncharacterized protein n=1 Tax=Pelobates cultripes TaxID=61616 RepID=A0AAD1RS45_PELCU|nr:Hypothetical predicted protein [Pelobates cultripes]
MDLQTLVLLDPSVSQKNQDPIGLDCGLLSGNQRYFAPASTADVDRSPGPVELDLVQDPSEPGLCLVNLLQSYLDLSAAVRNISQLFITSRNPFHPAKGKTEVGYYPTSLQLV